MQALEISGLKKTYQNGVQALRGIDLHIAPGDFFALLGPNGAGKSTTIGILASLVTKTAGEVRIFGHDLVKDRVRAKSCIGLVPQEFNFSVFETCEQIVVNQAGYYGVPRNEAKKRAKVLLGELGLWEKRSTQARMLSGGMKRRLMIARALMHAPKLLVLDEPTAGVDIELRRSMWDFLIELNRSGTTILLTTHYLEEAEQLCRNIAIIDHGKIIENTSMRALLNKLDVETFVLDLDEKSPKVDELGEFIFRYRDEHCIEVDVPKHIGLNRLFALLDGKNVRVISMRNKANRLEELFVRLIQRKTVEASS